MICLQDTIDISGYEMAKTYSDYVEIVPKKFSHLSSTRGWDYGATCLKAKFAPSDIVLDIGCACSYLIFYIAKFVKEVWGIDFIWGGGFENPAITWFQSLIEFEEYNSGKVRVIYNNAHRLPFSEMFFDKVITISVLEHFVGEDDIECSREVGRVLKPGGLFLGTVDFNEVTEYPQEGSRAYTYRTFIERVVKPSGLSLVGTDFIKNRSIPEAVDYIVQPFFFMLRKEL